MSLPTQKSLSCICSCLSVKTWGGYAYLYTFSFILWVSLSSVHLNMMCPWASGCVIGPGSVTEYSCAWVCLGPNGWILFCFCVYLSISMNRCLRIFMYWVCMCSPRCLYVNFCVCLCVCNPSYSLSFVVSPSLTLWEVSDCCRWGMFQYGTVWKKSFHTLHRADHVLCSWQVSGCRITESQLPSLSCYEALTGCRLF